MIIKCFVLKSSGISELINGIKEVAEERSYFSNDILIKLINILQTDVKCVIDREPIRTNNISKREFKVLKEITSGSTNKKIAEKLHISKTTVRSHNSNLLLKTQTNNTASLVMYAIKNKIVNIEN